MRIKFTGTNITAILVLLVALLSVYVLFFADWSEHYTAPRASPITSLHASPAKINAEISVATNASIPATPQAAPNGLNDLGRPSEVPFLNILDDDVLQIDFALAQSISRHSWSTDRMRTVLSELREQNGIFYQYKSINVYAGNKTLLFIQTLRDALLAWAEKASLQKADLPQKTDSAGVAWNIVLDGIVTHSLYILNENAPVAPPARRQPETAPGKPPELVIVMDDLGESIPQVNFLLNLDYPVTFAVWPRSTHAEEVAELAAESGVELIIHQPMEPVGYPDVNPGAGVLLSRMGDNEFMAVLGKNLNFVPGASGLNNHMGSWLTQNYTLMSMLARELKKQHYFVLDSLTHPLSRFADAAIHEGVTAYRRDIFLDVQPDKQHVLSQLKKAENIARLKGQAIAIGHPLPGTLGALKEWQTLRSSQIKIVRLRDLKSLK